MAETSISFVDLDEIPDPEVMESEVPEGPDTAGPDVPEASDAESSGTDGSGSSGVSGSSDFPDLSEDSGTPEIPWSHSYSFDDIGALLALSPDRWSRDELALCGQILADNDPSLAGEIEALKGMLVIDPGIVIRNISLRADCQLSAKPEGPVNYALCEAVALAWCRNITYYMPLQRKDPDTILDFCHLCWEYLQTVTVPDVPSIEARLVIAARPNGWIGSRSVFMTSEQRNFRYRAMKARRPRHELPADGLPVPKTHSYGASLVAVPYHTWEQIEEAFDLEYVEEVLTQRYPHLHVPAYMMICAADDRLIKTPSGWAMECAKIYFRRQGLRMTPVLLRRWFRACYEAVRNAAHSGILTPEEGTADEKIVSISSAGRRVLTDESLQEGAMEEAA